MRIVFMGTPEFAIPTLQRLVESHHEVALVVTQPDKEAGRGRKIQAPPVKEMALAHGLALTQPASVRTAEFAESLRALNLDAIVVVAYGKILPRAVLDTPRLGCLNIHASLLPRHRGAAPINWAILSGDLEAGVTIMRMDEGMDTGPVIREERVPILEDDDAVSLSHMLSLAGAQLMMQVLEDLEAGAALAGEPQDESRATLARLLRKEDGRIDWTRTTEKLVLQVRGLVPWPCAVTATPKGPLRILRVEPLWPSAVDDIKAPWAFTPGVVAACPKSDGFVMRTGDGFLLVTLAQASGKRAMSGVDLVNGLYVKEGDIFGPRAAETE